MSREIVDHVLGELSAMRDERRAARMTAYLKTEQPMLGVPEPARRPVFRGLIERYPPSGASEYRAVVCSLWEAGQRPGGFRELQYAAIGYAEAFEEHHDPAQFPLLRRLIVEGGWWDLVDGIATGVVGPIVLRHRARSTPVMRRWIDDEDMWVRRAAILCQLNHKEATDARLLFDFCLRRAGETQLFIRKAIGWALRQYARTNAEEVRDFLLKHRDDLPALSVREAGKHIGVAPPSRAARRTG